MQLHRFAVGETVLYAQRRHPHFTWRSPYTIVSCIKTEGPEPQYRIASIHWREIRVAGEHELCVTPQPLPVALQGPEYTLEPWLCLQPANLNVGPFVERPLAL
jgi:hypothetical protein